jgi:hypothetical protein
MYLGLLLFWCLIAIFILPESCSSLYCAKRFCDWSDLFVSTSLSFAFIDDFWSAECLTQISAGAFRLRLMPSLGHLAFLVNL